MFANKRGGVILLIVILIFIVGVSIGGFIAYKIFSSGGSTGDKIILDNPTDGLSNEDAVLNFNEDFVRYLLYSIGAGDLRKKPFSGDTPKIEFHIDEEIYSAEVMDGIVKVKKEKIKDEDIIIKTTTLEAVKMVRDGNYVGDSFRGGRSTIELVSGKIELASKGYMGIYNKLTGK